MYKTQKDDKCDIFMGWNAGVSLWNDMLAYIAAGQTVKYNWFNVSIKWYKSKDVLIDK